MVVPLLFFLIPTYTFLKGEKNVLGRLEFAPGGRGRGERDDLYGIPILTARADPEGILSRRRLCRAGRNLRRGGVVRTLLPKGFSQWELLERMGLRRVELGAFLQAQSPGLAVEALHGRDTDPRRATVALSGTRADEAMCRAALGLCPRVRRLVVDVPGGERLAHRLREEFGIPVLPAEHPAQLELRFQHGGRRQEEPFLELYGYTPHLDGLCLSVPELREEDREALDVLSVLWERGRLEPSRIKIHRN